MSILIYTNEMINNFLLILNFVYAIYEKKNSIER